jgi:GNAT superfamily N-acetyltransferase
MARVVRLDSASFEEAVGVLCDAFRDYPAMVYSLDGAGLCYDETLADLIGYLTEYRLTLDWPVLGVRAGEDLVAAALVNPPIVEPVNPSPGPRFESWRDGAGKPVLDRFRDFVKATEPFEPDVPFYFLGLLAVPPRHQGQGYARLLLDAVHDISRDDPASEGVVLTTETSDNVKLYEHFGYRALGQARVGDVPSWMLYRPDSL